MNLRSYVTSRCQTFICYPAVSSPLLAINFFKAQIAIQSGYRTVVATVSMAKGIGLMWVNASTARTKITGTARISVIENDIWYVGIAIAIGATENTTSSQLGMANTIFPGSV